MKRAFEKALKEKLKADGVKDSWIEKHLIVETIEETDVKKRKRRRKN